MSAIPRPDLPPGPHRDLVASTNDRALESAWLYSLRARAAADLVCWADAPERAAARSRVEQMGRDRVGPCGGAAVEWDAREHVPPTDAIAATARGRR